MLLPPMLVLVLHLAQEVPRHGPAQSPQNTVSLLMTQ